MDKQKLEEARQLAMSMTSHPVAFGTIEHTERAGELLADLALELEGWRRAAERCVTAWTVVRGGVWDPNGLMDEHVDQLRKALRPNPTDKEDLTHG